MKILKQEIKDSGRYEYDTKELEVDKGTYLEFRSHKHNNLSIGILKDKKGFYEVDICTGIEDSYEQGVAATIFTNKVSLEDVEKIIEVIIKSENNRGGN